MATTTNYSWTTPDNTAYVKDGASAIRTLGSSVDTTLFTALGGAYPGLRLVKKQTIGTAVSSVNVTGAFSATYDNYKIMIGGGVSSAAATGLNLKLGATATGYYNGLIFVSYAGTVGNNTNNNGSVFTNVGAGETTALFFDVELLNPFLTKNTGMRANYHDNANAGTQNGYLNAATSYTDFTITPSTGTITGGTIYVYGYGAS